MSIADNLDSRNHDEDDDDHHHPCDYYRHHNNNNHIDICVGHKSSDVFNGDDIKEHNEHCFDNNGTSIDIN